MIIQYKEELQPPIGISISYQYQVGDGIESSVKISR